MNSHVRTKMISAFLQESEGENGCDHGFCKDFWNGAQKAENKRIYKSNVIKIKKIKPFALQDIVRK